MQEFFLIGKKKYSYLLIFLLIVLLLNPLHYFVRVYKFNYNFFLENLQLGFFFIILLICFYLNFKINKKLFLIIIFPLIFLSLENIHYFIFSKNYGYKLTKNIFYISLYYFIFWFIIDNIELNKKSIKKNIINCIFLINLVLISFYFLIFFLESLNLINLKEMSNNHNFDVTYFKSNSFIPFLSVFKLTLLMLYDFKLNKYLKIFLFLMNLFLIFYIGKLGPLICLFIFFLTYFFLFIFKNKHFLYFIFICFIFQIFLFLNFENANLIKDKVLIGLDFNHSDKLSYNTFSKRIWKIKPPEPFINTKSPKPNICYKNNLIISCNNSKQKNVDYVVLNDQKILKISGQSQSSIIRNVTLKDSFKSFIESPLIGN